jgi:hypothetical protein
MTKGKRIIAVVILLTSVTCCFGQDTTAKKLPRLFLTSEQDEIMPGGMTFGPNGMMTSYGPTVINKHFFYFEGIKETKRVTYFAGNLAPYLKPVPEAYKTIQTYQFCRIATPLLIVAGLGTIIGSVVSMTNHQTKNDFGEYNPPDFTGVFIGGGIALASWIPYLASKGMVERAVNIYNKDSRVTK